MNEILPEAMKAAVYLWIDIIRERGGPRPEDMKKAQKTSAKLGERGDVLLFGGGKKGECADLFNDTAHAFAMLAFCPGGVDCFGTHFEAKRKDSVK